MHRLGLRALLGHGVFFDALLLLLSLHQQQLALYRELLFLLFLPSFLSSLAVVGGSDQLLSFWSRSLLTSFTLIRPSNRLFSDLEMPFLLLIIQRPVHQPGSLGGLQPCHVSCAPAMAIVLVTISIIH